MFKLFQRSKVAARDAQLSDVELVQAVRYGDKKAFVEIVTRYQGMVCGVALAILRDFQTSEDAGQEAFLTAWKKFDQLEDPARLRGWLAQIARNTALAELRKRGRVDSRDLEEASHIADAADAPCDKAATREEAALVLQTLDSLPEIYRVPLILYYRENQSVENVAQTLNLTDATVRQRLARGRELIREELSGVVENVLRRSRPTTAFTIGIAASIGALTAPSVIAAGALHAGYSGAVSNFFSAMTSSKSLIVGGAITAVVCMPVGYQVAAYVPHASLSPVATGAANPTSTEEQNKPIESALLVEWRELHEKYGQGPNAMPAIYAEIGRLNDPFRWRAFRAALISEWVQVDPLDAFNFLSGKSGDTDQRKQMLRQWLETNPQQAAQAILSADPAWNDALRTLLPEIAKAAPSVLGSLASRLPQAQSFWSHDVKDAFAVYAASDLEGARQAAESVSGANREQALSGIARKWAEIDFEAAVKWARNLPKGPETDEVLRTAIVARAAKDPTGALDSISMVPAGGRDTSRQPPARACWPKPQRRILMRRLHGSRRTRDV